MKKTKVFYLIAVFTVSALLLTAANARAVSDEARRYMARGQAAVEMAKSPADFEDAIKEFQKAIELAPEWPDAYYQLGVLQDKLGKYDDACDNLKHYLQLAPNANNAQEVMQLIYRIEYKKEKADESQAIIKTLTGSGALRWKSGKNPFSWPSKFRLRDGGLEALVLHSPLSPDQWVPVAYDGKQLQYEYNWYTDSSYAYKTSIKAEIISTSPLRLKVKEVEAQQWGDRSVGESEYVLEWVNDL